MTAAPAERGEEGEGREKAKGQMAKGQIGRGEVAGGGRGGRGGRGLGSVAVGLNITPMIDVVFLLLIYFVLTVSFSPREGSFGVDAPRRGGEPAAGRDPFELPRKPIVLVVRSFGGGEEEFAVTSDEPGLSEVGGTGGAGGAEELRRRLESERGRRYGEDQVFVIRGEGRARWEHALAALGAVRRAGYREVRLGEPAGGEGGR